jgi:hypothetical protein
MKARVKWKDHPRGDASRMKLSTSWFKREAVWIMVFSFAPFVIALLFFIVVMLTRYLAA